MMRAAPPLNGRRAQAARNDQVILDAARAVFIADPHAPISSVAAQAGVGTSALYRRYGSKEGLLRRLCRDGLAVYITEVQAALADAGAPWDAFATFMRRALDTDTHSLTLRLAGTFTATEDLYREGNRAHELTQRLLDQTKGSGAMRADVVVDDLYLIFEQLAAVHLGDDERSRQLRHRYLALLLQALQAQSGPPLPGPAPRWDEIQSRWGKTL